MEENDTVLKSGLVYNCGRKDLKEINCEEEQKNGWISKTERSWCDWQCYKCKETRTFSPIKRMGWMTKKDKLIDREKKITLTIIWKTSKHICH